MIIRLIVPQNLPGGLPDIKQLALFFVFIQGNIFQQVEAQRKSE
jgi:hypothetical protein